MSQAIAYTSRLGYLSIQGNLAGQQRRVYEAIRDWTGKGLPCIEEISNVTQMRLSSVCGRVNELRAAGCIEDAPLKINPFTGKTVKSYRAIVYREPLTRTDPQLLLFPETISELPVKYF